MRRLLPSSLLGQVLVAVAVALLVAQIVSATLLYRAAQNRIEAGQLNAVAISLLRDPIEDRGRLQGRFRGDERPFDLRDGPRGSRFRTRSSDTAPIFANEVSDERRAAALSEVLNGQGVEAHAVQFLVRRAGNDPVLQARAQRDPRFSRRPGWADRNLIVAGVQFEEGGEWRIARVFAPQREPGVTWGIVLQTFVLFVLLMAVLFVILRRITRPLARLTDRVGDFAANPDRAIRIEETGPADTRRLIAAHNAMEARIAAMLDEKDVMLGAIGHDLKTPLAALRVRIESVPDEAQRAKMADSIEDITQTLDDILILSRVGRDRSGAEAVDLGALMIGVTEEFEDLGEPVTINDPARLVATIQVTWVKRALRNLVSNAVRYGESAELTLLEESGHAILRVDDSGPGIAPDQIANMLEPFARGEASRNRATGGAGLGLTIARAIAEQHGGELNLANRAEGGLRAELHLPL